MPVPGNGGVDRWSGTRWPALTAVISSRLAVAHVKTLGNDPPVLGMTTISVTCCGSGRWFARLRGDDGPRFARRAGARALRPRWARVPGVRVVVLSAGLAGVTVAYEIGKAGYDCRVIEARARPGGPVVTVRRGTVSDNDSPGQTAAFDDGLYQIENLLLDRATQGPDAERIRLLGGAPTLPARLSGALPRERDAVPLDLYASGFASAVSPARRDRQRGAAGRMTRRIRHRNCETLD